MLAAFGLKFASKRSGFLLALLEYGSSSVPNKRRDHHLPLSVTIVKTNLFAIIQYCYRIPTKTPPIPSPSPTPNLPNPSHPIPNSKPPPVHSSPSSSPTPDDLGQGLQCQSRRPALPPQISHHQSSSSRGMEAAILCRLPRRRASKVTPPIVTVSTSR